MYFTLTVYLHFRCTGDCGQHFGQHRSGEQERNRKTTQVRGMACEKAQGEECSEHLGHLSRNCQNLSIPIAAPREICSVAWQDPFLPLVIKESWEHTSKTASARILWGQAFRPTVYRSQYEAFFQPCLRKSQSRKPSLATFTSYAIPPLPFKHTLLRLFLHPLLFCTPFPLLLIPDSQLGVCYSAFFLLLSASLNLPTLCSQSWYRLFT